MITTQNDRVGILQLRLLNLPPTQNDTRRNTTIGPTQNGTLRNTTIGVTPSTQNDTVIDTRLNTTIGVTPPTTE